MCLFKLTTDSCTQCSEYMGVSMKTQMLNGINWFAVWPVNIVCCIVFFSTSEAKPLFEIYYVWY